MGRLTYLLKPFTMYILQASLKIVGLILMVSLAAKFTLNIEEKNLFLLSAGGITLINILALPLTVKSIFTSNLSWLLNLPVSKNKLILLNIIQTTLSILLGAVISIIVFPICVWISFGITGFEHLDISSLAISLLKEIANINQNISTGEYTCILLASSYFFISFILFISPSYNNLMVVQTSLQIADQKKQAKQGLKVVAFLYGVLFFVFILREFLDDRVFSPVNIFFVLSLALPAAWASTCKSLIDESHRSRVVKYSLFGIVILSNIFTAIMTYSDVTNPKYPLKVRIQAFQHLGYFAPAVHDDLIKEANSLPNSKINITPLLLAQTKNPQILLESLLKSPISNKKKELINELIKVTGNINPETTSPILFMVDKYHRDFLKKLNYFDMSLASEQTLLLLMEEFYRKYKASSYRLCEFTSNKKLTKGEIETFLRSKYPSARYCGFILSRYYLEYDLQKSLYEASQASGPMEAIAVAISISTITGKTFSNKDFRSLSIDDWSRTKIDCPKSGKEFIKNFENYSYAKKVHCPRLYVKRTPIKNGGLDNYKYILDPKLKHCGCLEKAFK